MSLTADIYNFRKAIEPAFSQALTAAGLTCYHSGTAPELERARPRVEVAFLPGAALGRLFPATGLRATPGTLREMAYAATVHVYVISDASSPDSHEDTVAQVRSAMDIICRTVNDGLAHHTVQTCSVAGVSNSYSPEKGVLETQLQYAAKFNVRVESLTQLENET